MTNTWNHTPFMAERYGMMCALKIVTKHTAAMKRKIDIYTDNKKLWKILSSRCFRISEFAQRSGELLSSIREIIEQENDE